MREDTAYTNLMAFKNGKLDLDSIIAIDETWVPMYAPPSRHKAQFWLHPGEQAPNIPKPELHERKLLLTVGMDVTGVAFWGVLSENQCMNGERYCAFLEKYVQYVSVLCPFSTINIKT